MQTVKNKTTVLNLVFKEFLLTSIPPLSSVLYAEGYHDFPSKIVCLTLPKNFVGEPFSVSISGASKNFMYKRAMSRFSTDFFCLAVPKKFVREPFCTVFQKKSGTEKFSCIRGGGVSRFSVDFFLSHTVEKLHRGILLCFRKNLVSKKFMLQRVMSRFSVENFLSHSTETFRRGTLLCCVSEKFR